MSDELADHAALSEAFYPGTLKGNVDELLRLYGVVREAEREIGNLRRILLERSAKDAEGEEPFRVGSWIEGTTTRVRAEWRLTGLTGAGRPKWAPHLAFDNEARKQEYRRTQ